MIWLKYLNANIVGINKVSFCTYKKGYINAYCSAKCSNSSKESQEKMKHTCLKRFGTEHHMQNNEIKEKSKQTCLNKYGKEFIFQLDTFKENAKNTMLKKYRRWKFYAKRWNTPKS